MSVKKSVSKCTQVDTELVSVSLSAFDLAAVQEGLRIPSRPAASATASASSSSRHPRPARRLRRTFSDGYARNTSEEYLLDSCTFDNSSFGHDECSYVAHHQHQQQQQQQQQQFAYARQECVCSCPHPNYYYASSTLPRDHRRSDPFYSSDQNISSRIVADNRSSEELIVSQRSLDRKFKSSKLPKTRQSCRSSWERQSRTTPVGGTSLSGSKFELNFLPVKERSLDGADYPLRSSSRCSHTESRSCVVNRLNYSNAACERDAFDSQHVFVNNYDGYCDGESKGCARSLPPHFGDEHSGGGTRRYEGEGQGRPRKSYGLGGRRVIVPDGCEQDESFEMLYNVSGCQCERCDHAGYPGGYCHSQESLRADRQSGRSLVGSGLGTPLGAPPRAMALRPPSLTSSSTGTSSKVELAQRHWYAIATVLLVAGAAGVAVPLALRVSAGASLDERLELAAALLASSPLIDGHNDLPWNIRKFLHNKLKDFRFGEDLRSIPPWSTSPWSHTDLPRLKQGLVSAQFWAAYVPCAAQHKDAVQLVLEQIDVVRRLTEKYSPDLVLCTSSKEIKLAHAAGKVCSMLGVEGGHALGGSLGVLRALYTLGVRYLTLTSTCDTPWAECALADAMGVPAPGHEGLAPFGRLIIKEMNRLGMVVDLSHVSRRTMMAALNATEAPVVFSHSSALALCNSSRNVPDEVLKSVAENRGLVMVNFYSQFLTCKSTSTVADAIAHINHIREVAGIDSVGLGAGYDGINFTPKGLEDVSTYPLLFAELLAAGWTTEELKKLAGLNFLRVLEEVERIRDEQALAQIQPYEDVMQPKPAATFNCTSEDLF